MAKIDIADTVNKIGDTIDLYGWVHTRRDHGKLIFVDLRDRSGIVQVVFPPGDLHETADRLRPEWVAHIRGKVVKRPDNMVNPDIETGKVEVQPESIEIIAESKTPPFEIDNDNVEAGEGARMKYRYLDLRRGRMKRNLMLRHKTLKLVREYLDGEGFVEIETPILTKTSPEGARDFLVPSRFHPGKFYALPQAPQQYKQLLMIAGFEKYYQIARALRDEDLRADRQFEHTQIDTEMSFVTEEELRKVMEKMFIYVCERLEKKISQKPFPVFTYEEAMEKFGADKFDLRKDKKDPNEMAFAWVTDFPLFEKDEETGKLTFSHNPFSAPKPEHTQALMEGKELESLKAQQYDLVLNGFEIASGGVRISDPKVQRRIFEVMGLSDEEIDNRFGHLLEAYEYGAPPHAGLAPGLDRFVMILAGEDNIREVIAFPVTSHGQTAVMDAPSEVSKEQLDELHIQIKKSES